MLRPLILRSPATITLSWGRWIDPSGEKGCKTRSPWRKWLSICTISRKWLPFSEHRGEDDGERYRSPRYGTHYAIIVLIDQGYPGDTSYMEREAREPWR